MNGNNEDTDENEVIDENSLEINGSGLNHDKEIGTVPNDSFEINTTDKKRKLECIEETLTSNLN